MHAEGGGLVVTSTLERLPQGLGVMVTGYLTAIVYVVCPSTWR